MNRPPVKTLMRTTPAQSHLIVITNTSFEVEAAMGKYFSQNYIALPPWVGQSGAKQQPQLHDLNDCNGSPNLKAKERGGAEGQSRMTNTSVIKGGNQPTASSCRTMRLANTSIAKTSIRRVSCQIKIFIPLDGNLEKILAACVDHRGDRFCQFQRFELHLAQLKYDGLGQLRWERYS